MPRSCHLLLLTAVGLLSSVTAGLAEDVSTRKLLIKDHVLATKRQLQVQSRDVGVEFAEADDPSVHGAAIHIYSATDDFCAILPAGSDWQSNGKRWKYKNKTTKNSAQIGDGKLKVKIRSDVTYTLADDGQQGTANAQVQFGTGTRYCIRCAGNKKDDASKFQGKDCVATGCDAEPTECASTIAAVTTANISTITCSVTQAQLEAATQPHAYSESDNGVTRTITSNGIPNHDVGTFPNPGNPNSISAQSYNYSMAVVPSGAGEVATAARMINSIRDVCDAAPGILTAATAPMPRCWNVPRVG